MNTFDNFMEEINTVIKKYYKENAEAIIDFSSHRQNPTAVFRKDHIEVDIRYPLSPDIEVAMSEWPHTKIHIIIPTFDGETK
jgi:hypothetical protein